jgi:hypothetical protein
MVIDFLEKTGKGTTLDYFQPNFTLSRAANILRLNEEEKLKFILCDNKINYLKNIYRFKLEIIKREKEIGNKFVFN